MTAYTDDDVTAAADAMWELIDLVDEERPVRGLAQRAVAAVAPQIAARARSELLDEAVRFAREYEDQWGNEPEWFEVAGHLARADRVNE